MTEPTEITDSLLRRIKKMHAKSVSAAEIGSAAEAATFAEAVQKMLLKYKLTLSDLTTEELNKTEPIQRGGIDWSAAGIRSRRKRVAWVENLAEAVARAHYCRIFIHTGSMYISVVGRQSDREITEYMIVTLVRTAEELATKGYWKARYQSQREGHYDTGSYKTSFLNGFVAEIQSRYHALRNSQAKEPGSALVLSRSREELQKYVEEVIRPRSGAAVKGRTGKSVSGFMDGTNAGKTVNLNAHAVKAGETSSQKKLKG